MLHALVFGLAISTGVIAASVGMTIARRQMRLANRTRRKTQALTSIVQDGWSAWFMDGFASLGAGSLWFQAIVSCVLWASAGLCLIALGLLVFTQGIL